MGREHPNQHFSTPVKLTSSHSVVGEGVVARSGGGVPKSGSQEGNVLVLVLSDLNNSLKNDERGKEDDGQIEAFN
jgi:hypothetical protein